MRAKGTTVRQVLTGTVFLNFHHLHPEFQKFILRQIETVYISKKEVQSDVTFFLIVSVSALVPSFPLPYVISVNGLPFRSFFVAISFIHYVCILGPWHQLPYSIFSKRYRNISPCFLPSIQDLGSTGLSQLKETFRPIH